ncbi:MAG: alpha/beta hydrolase [Phycisphaerales bacterium]|nr:alpha/beta hydrolase [Phycisphaerales bacterium]
MPLPLFLTLLSCAAPAAPGLAADGEFDSGGVKIRYVTEGEGDAVVLIHGWMADSSMWGGDGKGGTKLSPLDGFRLIALDCRGHGRSDKPHDPEKYGAAMADDVVRLLDHLKIEKAHLIGYSSGAFIAGKVAAGHPGRVLSIVYACQAPVLPDTHVSFSDCEVFAKAVEQGKGLGAYIIASTPHGKERFTEEQADAVANFMFKGKDVKAFALAGVSFKHLEVTAEQLKKCTAPVLFIHGGDESDHVKKRVAAARKVLDRSEILVIEGANHMTTLIDPDFASTVIEFLNKAKSR